MELSLSETFLMDVVSVVGRIRDLHNKLFDVRDMILTKKYLYTIS